MVDLAENIARIVGFNYKIVPTDGYGSIGKDERWDGMIREILEEVFSKILCLYPTSKLFYARIENNKSRILFFQHTASFKLLYLHILLTRENNFFYRELIWLWPIYQ